MSLLSNFSLICYDTINKLTNYNFSPTVYCPETCHSTNNISEKVIAINQLKKLGPWFLYVNPFFFYIVKEIQVIENDKQVHSTHW